MDPIFENLDNKGLVVELFTTNYDMVLETVLDRFNKKARTPIETGWVGNVERHLDTDCWLSYGHDNREGGLLTKLHGSINWIRRDERILISASVYTGSHDKHAIIYPGFKGRPQDPVFQAFHNHLGRSLERASGVVFIGFAFRDEYINELCERYLSNSVSVVVINPEEISELPFAGDQVKHLKGGFNTETALQAAELLA